MLEFSSHVYRMHTLQTCTYVVSKGEVGGIHSAAVLIPVPLAHLQVTGIWVLAIQVKYV